LIVGQNNASYIVYLIFDFCIAYMTIILLYLQFKCFSCSCLYHDCMHHSHDGRDFKRCARQQSRKAPPAVHVRASHALMSPDLTLCFAKEMCVSRTALSTAHAEGTCSVALPARISLEAHDTSSSASRLHTRQWTCTLGSRGKEKARDHEHVRVR